MLVSPPVGICAIAIKGLLVLEPNLSCRRKGPAVSQKQARPPGSDAAFDPFGVEYGKTVEEAAHAGYLDGGFAMKFPPRQLFRYRNA